MKRITQAHWKKMLPRSKSWMVAKAFGFKVHVFWHLTRDGTKETQFGGSYSSREYALDIGKCCMEAKPEEYPVVKVRRDISYWSAAEHWNPAKTVIDEMVQRHYRCVLEFDGKFCSFTLRKKGQRQVCAVSEKPEEAICEAALIALGLLNRRSLDS